MIEAQRFLFDLPRFADRGVAAYKPGLERMMSLMEVMGRPDRAFPSVLIAGTNGKGSTASILASMAISEGYKTGLHTSPHLFFVGERMRINGLPARQEWIARAVSRFAGPINTIGTSFFEATTALTFLYFAEENVDLAVVEVGLGGRFDATNVLNPLLCVITGIALDHTEILGESLSEIAAEKAGITKPGTPLLTGAVQPEVLSVLRNTAKDNESPFHVAQEETRLIHLDNSSFSLETPDRVYEGLQIDLRGDNQKSNAALAIRAAEICACLVGISESSIRTGLRDVMKISGLRGRLEQINHDPVILVDVAHNVEAIGAALATTREYFGRVSHVFIGLLNDKNADEIAGILSEFQVVVSTVGLESERSLDAVELASVFRSACVPVENEAIALGAAIDQFVSTSLAGDVLLITGSHHVAKEALAWADSRTRVTDTGSLP